MNRVLIGCLAGFAATLPMTAAMVWLHRRLPEEERYPLPPHEVTKEASKGVGLEQHVEGERGLGLTLTAHFAFGTAAGGVYGLLDEKIPLPPTLRGSAYGLAVWAVNYLGLLPAAGLFRPPAHEPPRRKALMAAAHLVWGPVLGVLVDRLHAKR
jgi:uncharacterized membrane protein YagU involved in acid resistance